MRTIYFIAFLALAITSCKKNNTKKESGVPELTTQAPRCEGGTIKSVAFPFNISHNGAIIKSVELYKSPSTKISENTSVDYGGLYTLYHSQLAACPKQSDNAMYYFVITKSDDSKINTTPFQVYF